MTVRLPGFVIV